MRTATLLLLISVASLAGDAPLNALVGSNGSLRISSGNRTLCDFTPGAFEPGWKFSQAIGSSGAPATATSRPFKIKVGGGEIVGSCEAKQEADGTGSLAYSFTPSSDVSVLSTHINADFAIAQLAGMAWSADDKEGSFPTEFKTVHLHNGTMKTLSLKLADGTTLKLDFAEPTAVLLQDNRQWGPTFSIRIGPQYGGPTAIQKGITKKVAFKLTTTPAMSLSIDMPVTIVAGADWVPLKLDLDIEAGSALDFSKFGFHDAPAGKHGRIVARADGQFAFEKNPEVARKFYGVNFCFGAHYLSKEEADRVAERLVRLGYNALRFHHHEHELTSKQPDSTTLNPEKLEQFDYLMSALIQRGVYLTTDLFVSRPVKWKDIGVEKQGNIEMDTFKILVPAVPAAYENWKAFAKNFLTHKNPHTGRTYAEEPALAWLSMINEGTYGNFLDRVKQVPEWNKLWQEWIQKRYPSREKLAEAWKTELKADEDPTKGNVALPSNIWVTNARVSDCSEFFAERERLTVEKMRAFLRDELGCKALITNMNAWTYHVADQNARATFDYVDDHFYVDHPEFIENPWRLPSKCPNTSPIAGGATGGRQRAFTRIYGKPFTITEFNYSGPGRFRGVGGILTGAMGAFQDWNAMWRFAYSHGREAMLRPERLDYFNMATDPLGQASERATLCLFVRGDLKPAPQTLSIVMTDAESLAQRPQHQLPPKWDWAAWITRVGTHVARDGQTVSATVPFALGEASQKLAGADAILNPYSTDNAKIAATLKSKGILSAENPTDPAKQLFVSSTGEITIDGPADVMILDTPRTAGGYAPMGKSVNAAKSGVSVAIQEADATVFVNALDDKPIRESARLLVTHLTDLQNTEIKYAERARQTLLDWGKLPHLVRAGKAEVKIQHAQAAKLKVWVLSTSGKRIGEVKSSVADGTLIFNADVSEGAAEAGARMLYEISEK